MEWQSIESAPENEKCLCFNGRDIYVLIKLWGSWKEPANLMTLRHQPTHWMALPKPPKEAKD